MVDLPDNKGRKEFHYAFNDPIFMLSDENNDISGLQKPECNCCDEKYKTTKDAKYCQFCAKAFCQKCRYKTKVFPKSDTLERGEICVVCDRKFFIRAILIDKNTQIEAQTN